MRPTIKLLSLLFILSFSFAADARAEAVTSGSLTTNPPTGGAFLLAGQGFTLRGGVNYSDTSCLACRSGETVSFSSRNSGLDVRSGSGVIGSNAYDRLYYDAVLNFGGSVVIPPLADIGATGTTLYSAFTFSGVVNACTSSTISGCQPGYVFSSQLSGSGIATIQLLRNAGTDLFRVGSIRYDFNPQPVPEPATLILLGTGLAGTIAARRRRRRNGDAEVEPDARP